MFQYLTLSNLLQMMAAAAQAACSTLTNLTVGSPLLAVLESFGGIALWLQWLVLLLLAQTRLATCFGAAVDTWVGDFGLVRLPAAPSSGSATFTSLSTVTTRLIAPGVTVKTTDGTATFAVTTDTTNAAWNTAQGGYVMAIGTASVSVPVQSTTAGAAGNIQAGAISLLASAIPGVDLVTNPAPFANGLDAETDAALKARFQLYIESLSKATDGALIFAAESVQQNVVAVAVDNAPGSGMVTLYVDDGSGDPPNSLLSRIMTAVQAVRPATVQVLVLAPTINGVSINAVLQVSNETLRTTAVAEVSSAIAAYVDALPIGAPLPFLNLAQVALNASETVTGLTTFTVNGARVDIAGGTGAVIKVTTLTVA